MTREPLRIVIAGGGTGGHLYPGVAVARELLSREPDALITFAGTAKGIESRVVPKEGFALDLLRSSGLKGKSLVDRVRGALTLPAGLRDAWNIVANRRPHLVLGVGGYSSGPVVLIAALRGVPTMLIEQNAVPGLTNRLLSFVVRAAGVTFESTREFFGEKAFVSGNPVRPEFLEVGRRSTEAGANGRTSAIQVLVFGGSQGAHAINVAMVEAAAKLASGPALRLSHQTGERDLDMVRAAYGAAGLQAEVEPFFYDMGRRRPRSGPDRLPGRRDDDCGTDGGREGGDSHSAADCDRRSPAQERRGAGGGARRRSAVADGRERAGAGGTDRGAGG